MIDYLFVIVIPVCLLIICLSAGWLLSRVGGISLSPAGCTAAGYIAVTALFHLIALPFMQFGLHFTALFWASILLVLAIVAAAAVTAFRQNHTLLTSARNVYHQSDVKKAGVVWLIVLAGIAFQLLYSVLRTYSDADDSFFVTQINTILHTNRVLVFDPSSGLPELSLNPTYKLVSYEIVLSVISKAFHVHPAFLCHTILPVFLIPLHYIIISLIGRKLFDSHANCFVLLYLVTNLFSRFSGYNQGVFLVYRPWQGKVVLAAIIIPAVIWMFLEAAEREHLSAKAVIPLLMLLLSGMHASTIGIFLVPIAYFTAACGYAVYTRFNIRNLLMVVIPVILMLPLVILKYLTLAGDKGVGFGELTESAERVQKKITYSGELIGRFFNGHIVCFTVFVVALIFITVVGDRKIRLLIGLPVIVMWLTFANPLLMSFISEHVTSKYVYWRLFWLLQPALVIVTAIQLIAEKMKTTARSIAVIAAGILMICLIGKPAYPGDFKPRPNRYKLDAFAVELSEAIRRDGGQQDVCLLLPLELSYEVRQYDEGIMLPVNRYSPVNYTGSGLKEKYHDLHENLEAPLYLDRIWDPKDIVSATKRQGIDYVVVLTDTIDANQIPSSWVKIDEIAVAAVYRCR